MPFRVWPHPIYLDSGTLHSRLLFNIVLYNLELYFLFFPLLSHVQLFVNPWTVVYQAPPLMGFSRQEYWSGLPFPSRLNFTFSARYNQNWASFPLWLILLFFSVAISPLFPSLLDTFLPRRVHLSVSYFLPFILFMGLSKQEYWSDLPFFLQWAMFCQALSSRDMPFSHSL